MPTNQQHVEQRREPGRNQVGNLVQIIGIEQEVANTCNFLTHRPVNKTTAKYRIKELEFNSVSRILPPTNVKKKKKLICKGPSYERKYSPEIHIWGKSALYEVFVLHCSFVQCHSSLKKLIFACAETTKGQRRLSQR